MTQQEFSSWVEQHYAELVKVARKRCRDPEAAVQDAVVTFLTNRDLAAIARPWTYLVNAIRSTSMVVRRSSKRDQALRREVKKVARAGHSHGWKRPAPTSDNPQGDHRDMGNR